VSDSAANGRVHGLRVGAVVVNWNGHVDTISCLESLVCASQGPERVVLIDNGSATDSLASIEQWTRQRQIAARRVASSEAGTRGADHWLTIVASPENLGYAEGCNLGLAVLERCPELTHFLLLNNDATVAADFFDEIARSLNDMPRAGLLTGTILEAAAPHRVWYAGGRLLPLRGHVEHLYDPPTSSRPVETEFVSGCAMLVSREARLAIGGLASCYSPGYWEDTDYSVRVRATGLPLVYAPRATVYHKVGRSFGLPWERPRVAFWQNRNRVFFVRRNLRGWRRAVALAYLAVTKPGRALVEVIRGRPRYGWAILHGTIVGFLDSSARR
jgi:hypothetical protein